MCVIFFQVEQVLARRKNKQGNIEYLIRWKGYSPEWDTWEPLSGLGSALDIIEEFNEKEALGKFALFQQQNKATLLQTLPLDHMPRPKSQTINSLAINGTATIEELKMVNNNVPAKKVRRNSLPDVGRAKSMSPAPEKGTKSKAATTADISTKTATRKVQKAATTEQVTSNLPRKKPKKKGGTDELDKNGNVEAEDQRFKGSVIVRSKRDGSVEIMKEGRKFGILKISPKTAKMIDADVATVKSPFQAKTVEIKKIKEDEENESIAKKKCPKRKAPEAKVNGGKAGQANSTSIKKPAAGSTAPAKLKPAAKKKVVSTKINIGSKPKAKAAFKTARKFKSRAMQQRAGKQKRGVGTERKPVTRGKKLNVLETLSILSVRKTPPRSAEPTPEVGTSPNVMKEFEQALAAAEGKGGDTGASKKQQTGKKEQVKKDTSNASKGKKDTPNAPKDKKDTPNAPNGAKERNETNETPFLIKSKSSKVIPQKATQKVGSKPATASGSNETKPARKRNNSVAKDKSSGSKVSSKAKTSKSDAKISNGKQSALKTSSPKSKGSPNKKESNSPIKKESPKGTKTAKNGDEKQNKKSSPISNSLKKNSKKQILESSDDENILYSLNEEVSGITKKARLSLTESKDSTPDLEISFRRSTMSPSKLLLKNSMMKPKTKVVKPGGSD